MLLGLTTNNAWTRVTSVEYFIGRYPSILNNIIDLDTLHEQFLSYQIFDEEILPDHVKDACGIIKREEDYKFCRVDVLWAFLKEYQLPGTNEKIFNLLFKVARGDFNDTPLQC